MTGTLTTTYSHFQFHKNNSWSLVEPILHKRLPRQCPQLLVTLEGVSFEPLDPMIHPAECQNLANPLSLSLVHPYEFYNLLI